MVRTRWDPRIEARYASTTSINGINVRTNLGHLGAIRSATVGIAKPDAAARQYWHTNHSQHGRVLQRRLVMNCVFSYFNVKGSGPNYHSIPHTNNDISKI